MQRIGRTNSTGLQFELLQLKTDGCGRQVENSNLEQLNHYLTCVVIERAAGISNVSARECLLRIALEPVQRLFNLVVR